MKRWMAGLCLWMGMVLGLPVLACGPSTPTPPVAVTSAPPPVLSPTPSPGATTSTPATPSPGVTPSPTATQLPTPTLRIYQGFLTGSGLISAVQEPTDIQLTLRTMTQLGDYVRGLSLGVPTGSDLVTVTGQTASLMTQVQQQIPSMNFTQRQQAIQLEQELVSGIVQAQSIYIYQGSSTGPTTSLGTPVVVPGTPLVVIGTPVPPSQFPPFPAQVLSDDIQQLQLNAAQMATGHPDNSAITTWLTSMTSTLSTLRQLVSQLDPSDLEQLSGGVAQATTTMIRAMQAYVSR